MGRKIGEVTVIVRDYDEAIAFYTSALGFELIEDTALAGGKRWIVVGPAGYDGTRLLLAKAATPEQEGHIGNQAGGRVFLFLHTDDFWRDYHDMKARGVRFMEEPRHEAYGTVAVFVDLYGNRWDLIEPSDIRLRDVTEGDLPIFFEHQRDSEANQMAAFPARDWDAFIAHWTKILADKTEPVKTILFDGQVAGNIVSWERDSKRLVGYWIGKNDWGKGVATKALSEFLKILTTRPLYAHVAKRNIASIRVLKKCGFAICSEMTKALEQPSDGVEEYVFRLDAHECHAID